MVRVTDYDDLIIKNFIKGTYSLYAVNILQK